VSFDGAGGTGLWEYWRAVARRVHAHFTFFVSGVYLLDVSQRRLYHPPGHEAGSSDIGFAQPEGDLTARGTLDEIAAGYLEGHEIGTHYNGHFCAPYPGNVGDWNADDWRQRRLFDLRRAGDDHGWFGDLHGDGHDRRRHQLLGIVGDAPDDHGHQGDAHGQHMAHGQRDHLRPGAFGLHADGHYSTGNRHLRLYHAVHDPECRDLQRFGHLHTGRHE